MRILVGLIALILFATSADGQNLRNIDAIQLNTKFTLELSTDASGNISYNIVSKEPYKDELQMSSVSSLLEADLENNQIQGVFAIGTFGDRRSILLVMKNGLNKHLQYELFIDSKGRGKHKKTSTHPLMPGIPSTEIWPYNIYSLKIASFQEIEIEPITIPEPEIDSTCLLNSGLTIENGEHLFRQHLNKVNTGLINLEPLNLESMLAFEDSINSEDVSLGHYYSLGEGIYPYFKNYTFGDPLQYRRVECPYFDGYSSYFYTKNEKNLKVAGYNWGEFKSGDWSNRIDRSELREAFEQKYASIKVIVTEVLGKPLPLNEEPNSGRIDTKWKSSDGINAYLFMFGNYNEIRLYVYRD